LRCQRRGVAGDTIKPARRSGESSLASAERTLGLTSAAATEPTRDPGLRLMPQSQQLDVALEFIATTDGRA
jgi:hypothetical protein